MGGALSTLISLAIAAAVIAGGWKMFQKAGQPGWAFLIPIYNSIKMLQMVGRPTWWVVLMFVPLVNLLVWVIVALDLAKAFGKGTGFGVGLMFLSFIFVPILGFGDAQYHGSAGSARLRPAI